MTKPSGAKQKEKPATKSKKKYAGDTIKKNAASPGASMEGQALNNHQSLQIKSNAGNQLSPSQLKFNKLTRQIEKLQNTIERQTQTLDQMQAYYTKEVLPVLTEEKAVNISYIKALFAFYKRKRKELTKEEHKALGELLMEEYESTIQLNEDTDPELQEIHKKLYRQSPEESLNEGFNMLKVQTIEYMRMNGVEVEDDIFDEVTDMDQMQAKLAEVMDEFVSKRAEAESCQNNPKGGYFEDPYSSSGSRATRKPTKKELEKRHKEQQKEVLKEKGISRIYKQLAKCFHPDLEQDQLKKSGKEQLMQQLTQAYKQKDLHLLLQLELKWLKQEDQDIQQLAEEKLKLYIEVLQDQAAELKMKANNLKAHPRYAAVMEFSQSEHPSLSNMRNSLKELLKMMVQTRTDTERLNKNNAGSILLLKDIIKEYNLVSEYWGAFDDPIYF